MSQDAGVAADQRTEPSPPPGVAGERGPLRRSTSGRVVAGVAAGLARWLGIEVGIVRIAFVILAVFGGSGLALYGIGWLCIPPEGSTITAADRLVAWFRRQSRGWQVVLIILLVLAGITVLGGLQQPRSGWPFGGAGVLALLIVGGVVAWLLTRQQSGTGGTPMSMSTESTSTQSTSTESTTVERGQAQAGPSPASKPVRSPSPLGAFTMFLGLTVIGLLATLNSLEVTSLATEVVLAAGLAVLGIGLVIGAVVGHARWLFWVAVGLLAFILVLGSSTPGTGVIAWRNDSTGSASTIGDQTWRPIAASETANGYSLGMGTATLDLTALDLTTPDLTDPDLTASDLNDSETPVARIPISARVDMGTLIVLVPADMTVVVDAGAGLGTIDITPTARPGTAEISGVNQRVVTTIPGQGPAGQPMVSLQLRVGMGTVEVNRA